MTSAIGSTGPARQDRTLTRTAADWWRLAGATLSPPGRREPGGLDPATRIAARTALIMATDTLATELVQHLVRAGATPLTTTTTDTGTAAGVSVEPGVRVGQVRVAPGGTGDVIGVELRLAGTAPVAPGERVQVLMLPQHATLPVYRWDDRDTTAAVPVTSVTVPGAVDGAWLDLQQLALVLLPLLGVTPPPG